FDCPESVVFRSFVLPLLPRLDSMDHCPNDERASNPSLRSDEVENDGNRPARRCAFCHSANSAVPTPPLDRRRRAAARSEHAATGTRSQSVLWLGWLHGFLVDGARLLPQSTRREWRSV